MQAMPCSWSPSWDAVNSGRAIVAMALQRPGLACGGHGGTMYLLGIGSVLLVLTPFALAVAWWAWADWSGYTKRRAMEKMDKRRTDRIERQRDALGQGTRRGGTDKQR